MIGFKTEDHCSYCINIVAHFLPKFKFSIEISVLGWTIFWQKVEFNTDMVPERVIRWLHISGGKKEKRLIV